MLCFFALPLSEIMFKYLPDCIYATMGFACSACGATHCVNYLAGGNISAAIRANVYIFFIIVYLAVLIVFLNLSLIKNFSLADRIVAFMTNYKMIIVLAAFAGVFTIIRNLI